MIYCQLDGRLIGQATESMSVVTRELVTSQCDGQHPHVTLVAKAGPNGEQLRRLAEGERVEVRGKLVIGSWTDPRDGKTKPRGTVRVSSVRRMHPKHSTPRVPQRAAHAATGPSGNDGAD